MLSRRKFLQSNVISLALPLAPSRTLGRVPLADPASAEFGHPFQRDYWLDWPPYLTRRMNEARARRKTDLATLKTEADVRQRP